MGLPKTLDVDLLRSFVSIAECGSFSGAAERIGRTQSTVSLQIQRLESLLDHRLFSRGKGEAPVMTTHGLELLNRAREFLSLHDSIVGAIRTFSDDGGGLAFAPQGTGFLRAHARPVSGASLAILPFRNLSDDPNHAYFADGVVEDIIAGLSRIPWLFVIGRNSLLAFQGRTLDVRQLDWELGVRYILEGAVRRAGARLRITAKLVEAESGRCLWADKFDGSLEDVFDLQDEVTERVVGIIEPNLWRAEIERSRRKRPDSLEAYDFYLRALPYTATQMPGEAAAAVKLLERALKLDPDYTAVHALLAWSHEWLFARGGSDEFHRAAGLDHARAVTGSGGEDPYALAIAGFVLILLSGDRDGALAAADRAMTINASCASALYLSAQINAFAGRPSAASACAKRALRLSPFDYLTYEAHLALGTAALQEGRYEDAASHYAASVRSNPRNSSNYFLQAIALALAGRLEDGGRLAKTALKLEPGFRYRWFYEFTTPEIADTVARGARRLSLAR
jgi:adenylate cyclase